MMSFLTRLVGKHNPCKTTLRSLLSGIFCILVVAVASLTSQSAKAVLGANEVAEFYTHMRPCLSKTIEYGQADVEVCEYLVDPTTTHNFIDLAPTPGSTLRFTVPYTPEFEVTNFPIFSWTVTGVVCNHGDDHQYCCVDGDNGAYCDITVPDAGTEVTIKAGIAGQVTYEGQSYSIWGSTEDLVFSVPGDPLTSLNGTSHKFDIVTNNQLTIIEPTNLDNDPATYPNGHPVVLNFHGHSTGAPPYGNYEESLKQNGFYVINVGLDYDYGHPWLAYDSAAAAVRWVRAHSSHSPNSFPVRNSSLKLDIDPDKVYATGFSAGATVAAFLGFVERDENASPANYIARFENAVAQTGLPVKTMEVGSLVHRYLNQIYSSYSSEVQGIITLGASFDISGHSSYGYMVSENVDTSGLDKTIYTYSNGTALAKQFLNTNAPVADRVSVPYFFLNTWASDFWYMSFDQSSSYSSPERLTSDGITGAGIGSPIHQMFSAVSFVDTSLSAPKVPVIIMMGTADNVAHFENAVMSGRYLKANQYNIKTIVLPGTGHIGSPSIINPGQTATKFFTVLNHMIDTQKDSDPGNDLDINNASDFGAASQSVYGTDATTLLCGVGLIHGPQANPGSGYYCDEPGTAVAQ